MAPKKKEKRSKTMTNKPWTDKQTKIFADVLLWTESRHILRRQWTFKLEIIASFLWAQETVWIIGLHTLEILETAKRVLFSAD